MRATNLQELVYKNGQAGVTKASVSITFDNRNKKQSPLGYDQYDEIVITRQVIIGGKNKYMINGANIQANRVADFFRSVQLNVNNPHFLIMQGRITKVLNMKPPEVRAYWILFYYASACYTLQQLKLRQRGNEIFACQYNVAYYSENNITYLLTATITITTNNGI